MSGVDDSVLVTAGEVRAMIRAELAKHIPEGVLRANEGGGTFGSVYGPLAPEQWAGAVQRDAEYQKRKIDRAAGNFLSGTDDSQRDAGPEPEVVSDVSLVDGEPHCGDGAVLDGVGQSADVVGVGVADRVGDSVVDDLGHGVPSVVGGDDGTRRPLASVVNRFVRRAVASWLAPDLVRREHRAPDADLWFDGTKVAEAIMSALNTDGGRTLDGEPAAGATTSTMRGKKHV